MRVGGLGEVGRRSVALLRIGRLLLLLVLLRIGWLLELLLLLVALRWAGGRVVAVRIAGGQLEYPVDVV